MARIDVKGSLRIAGAEVEVGAKQSFALSVIGQVAFAMLAHRPRRPRRPRLVLAHETALANDVDCEDRGEAAGGGHCSGTPALRRSSTRRSPPVILASGALARSRAMVKVGFIASPN
jgi:hypothetical protein